MKTNMTWLRAGTWGVTALAVVPHIFTCVLPTLAAVLGTTGLLGTAWMHTPWGMTFMKYHFVLLIVATLAAVVGFVSTLVKYRCGCGPSCACGPDCDCATAPRGGKGALVFSALLLVFVGASWLASPFKHAEHMAMMEGHAMMMPPAAEPGMPPLPMHPEGAPHMMHDMTPEDAARMEHPQGQPMDMPMGHPMEHGDGAHTMPEGEMR